jgi:predicted nucleic acid-binding protein
VIVVDASALLEIFLRTARGDRIWNRLFGADDALHAPHLIDLEVAQVMRRYVSRGEVDADRGRAVVDLMSRMPITRYSHEPMLSRIWALRANATAYDAAYLALAEGLRAPLVTCDDALAKIPGVSAAVEVF